MSPEQKLGADIDTRSDLFSVGVVFYELLTGHKPYQTRTGNYADLRRELDADVPELPTELSYLQPLVDKLLAKDPNERFQSAGKLMDAIERVSGASTSVMSDATVIQKSALPSAKPTPSVKPRWSVKKKITAAASAALIVLITVAIGLIPPVQDAFRNLLPKPEPVVTPVDEETAREIQGLLDTVQIYLNMGRLIDSGPSNAVNLYSRVLELQAGNPEATKGMESAFEQILVDIRAFIDAGDSEAAQGLIKLSEHYFPDNEDLADLREQAGF
jgi:serine/threonine protein kinase